LTFANVEFIEGGHQIADEGVEFFAGDAHACMAALHVSSFVRTGTAGGLANLLGEHGLQARDAGVRKLAIDATVGGDASDEVFHDGGDCELAAKTLVERFLARHCRAGRLHVVTSPQTEYEATRDHTRGSPCIHDSPPLC